MKWITMVKIAVAADSSSNDRARGKRRGVPQNKAERRQREKQIAQDAQRSVGSFVTEEEGWSRQQVRMVGREAHTW